MNEKKIILAVDDMPENLIQFGSLLGDYFDVRLAKSAGMALNILSKIRVDLILLDIEMPEMSGFDFLNQLHEKKSVNDKTPVIFVTSHADLDVIGRAIKLGAKDYIVKPITTETLYKKIDAVIGIPVHIPHIMEGKLQELISALMSANIVEADRLINELLGLAKWFPHIHKQMEDVAKVINDFEYEEGIQKITVLIQLLDLDKAQ
jgi:response regulator RpfG family c-di-GMP phosphodiesterase